MHDRRPKSNFCGVNNGAKAQGVAAAGYGLKFRWLFMRCNFTVARYPNSEPYPCGALAPWFHLVLHSVKLRLQNRDAIFSLRMTNSGFVGWCALESGTSRRRPLRFIIPNSAFCTLHTALKGGSKPPPYFLSPSCKRARNML